MDTVIHLNVDSLNDAFIKDLREQYGSAEIELRVQKKPQHWLAQDQFWALIGLLDWSKSGDDDAVVQPLIKALSGMPIGNIHQFQDILSEKLWKLDTEAHAEASQPNMAIFSADGFLYDRCCVVANGKSFYDSVLLDSSKFPVGYSFSALLSVAADAYTLKTGQVFQHVPRFSIETGSNLAGWDAPSN